nr:EOG090X05X4 [Lepidurus arcticus]
MSKSGGNTLLMTYEGSNFIRQRLVLSVLSGRPVKITKIRSKEGDPGLKEHEASLLRLFDKLTNGSTVEVSETGTALFFQPGLLIGGNIEHDCSLQRSIGYYLEPLFALGPFCKKPLRITLRGISNDNVDPSVDTMKASGMSLLKRFLIVDDGLEFKINKRGAAPKGGGEVFFSCPVRKQLRPIQYVDPGKIKKIRGVAWAVRVSPALANRIVEAAKGLLLNYLSDVFILTDHRKGASSGLSPGFGIVLTAETVNGTMLTAEACSLTPGPDQPPSLAEDVGLKGAQALLEEIYRGGCVDSNVQSLALLHMTLSQKDVSKIQTGPISPYTVKYLQHIRDFFGTMFKMETQTRDEDENLRLGGDKVLLTCLVLIAHQKFSFSFIHKRRYLLFVVWAKLRDYYLICLVLKMSDSEDLESPSDILETGNEVAEREGDHMSISEVEQDLSKEDVIDMPSAGDADGGDNNGEDDTSQSDNGDEDRTARENMLYKDSTSQHRLKKLVKSEIGTVELDDAALKVHIRLTPSFYCNWKKKLDILLRALMA